ncbi:MAG: hypothetical protein AAB538_01330 [Patescibacteria group bacterium]
MKRSWLWVGAVLLVAAVGLGWAVRQWGGRVNGISKQVFDPSGGKCQGKGLVMFGTSVFELKKLATILPMGGMIYDHVTPIDHGYMFGVGTPNIPPDTFGIYAPANGYVVEMARMLRGGKETFVDHILTIEFSCTHYLHLSNMSSFAPRLIQEAGVVVPNSTRPVRIPVLEGELIARTGPYGIDVYVWDKDVKLTGYIVPEHYNAESWKLHSADFFNYVKEPLKSQLLAKNLRQASPRFGKIDYDIDGKLIGNWFKVGTYGYAGRPPSEPGGGDYWRGHLAFAPDYLDPTGFVVSIGNWQGQPKQFAVKGNTPHPKNISVSSGVVKYELVQPDHVVASTGEFWDRRTYVKGLRFTPNERAFGGVLLVQLVAPRQLKIEMFPGKAANQVSGFSQAAIMYER